MNESGVPDKDLRRAFVACLRAHETCEETVTHALRAEATHADDERIGVLLDCADVCRTTARLIRRGSPLVRGTAGVCVELCERAAETCAAVAGDPVMAACAETCRRCATWCRWLAEAPLARAA
jgi:hypothetical protein